MQAFAASVRRTYTISMCGAQRPVAYNFALQLHWFDARRTTAKNLDMCLNKRRFLNFFFFFCQSRRAFLKALLLCLFGGERQGSVVRPFLASSKLSIVKIDVSEISKPPTRLPTLKNDSHEAWKCSVTRKKYFERPHTVVFRRQRLGTTPSTQTGRSFWRQASTSSSLISTRTP